MGFSVIFPRIFQEYSVPKLYTKLFAASLILLLASSARAEKKPADGEKSAEATKEDLPTAIANGIKLLEAEKTNEFLDRCMIPADMEKLKKSNQYDAIKEEFKKDHSA